MFTRALILLLAVFWLGMNVLLWRMEFGGRSVAFSSVPEKVVWQKLLTAPDPSSMAVYHHGRKVGFCRFLTSVSEEGLNMTDETPNGARTPARTYQVRVDGTVALERQTNRANVRFESALELGKDLAWRQ